MEQRQGIAVSPGVAIGSALVLGTEDFRVPQKFVRANPVDVELSRFRSAQAAACVEISTTEQLASSRLGGEYGAIFAAHLQLIQDPKLTNEIEDLVRNKNYSPEFATSRVLRKYAKQLQALGDPYLAGRAADLFAIEKRLLRHLSGEQRHELADLTAPAVVLAHNLTPGETANLDTQFVLGFATEVGGKGSHTAILAGALEIPAVVGVGDFLSEVSGGETVIIDGHQGIVIVDPDEATIERYRHVAQRGKTAAVKLRSLLNLKSQTSDGADVHIYGNIEFPSEVNHCTGRGAEGIGLYRTEFLYLGHDDDPSEETHYQAYRQVLEAFPNMPVVIRTLDLGAEKFPKSMESVIEDSDNPSLGLRGLRLCLAMPQLFKRQLRAILRAAVDGDLRIMFPMVSTLREFRQAKMIVADVADDLKEEGLPYRNNLPIGIMVEIPAAVIMADSFAQEVDFFSIGTNDLIQYTLGVDRTNPAVAGLYSSADPVVFRMIRTVVEAAAERNLRVSVCGQMSSDPIYTAALVGLGLRELSITPHMIPEIKQVVRNLALDRAREIVRHVLTLDAARDVENYLREELKKLLPESAN